MSFECGMADNWPADCGYPEPQGICGAFRYCRRHGGSGRDWSELDPYRTGRADWKELRREARMGAAPPKEEAVDSK